MNDIEITATAISPATGKQPVDYFAIDRLNIHSSAINIKKIPETDLGPPENLRT